jgi:hypothetical protein
VKIYVFFGIDKAFLKFIFEVTCRHQNITALASHFLIQKTSAMKHKIITLFFLAGITCANAFAQPTIKAQRTIGGYRWDHFASMDLAKDGGLIVGGWSNSTT